MPTINCPTCSAKLKLPEQADLQAFKCPKCASVIEARSVAATDGYRAAPSRRANGAPAAPVAPPRQDGGADTIPCRYCGEQVLWEARKCKHCCEILDPDLRESRRRDSRDDDDRRDYRPPREVRSSGVAVMLEVLPGLFFQTFGIGHLYAGNVGAGLGFMLGYWAVLGLNVGLAFCGIGFVTGPLCWLLCMIISPILAAQYCNEVNSRGR